VYSLLLPIPSHIFTRPSLLLLFPPWQDDTKPFLFHFYFSSWRKERSYLSVYPFWLTPSHILLFMAQRPGPTYRLHRCWPPHCSHLFVETRLWALCCSFTPLSLKGQTSSSLSLTVITAPPSGLPSLPTWRCRRIRAEIGQRSAGWHPGCPTCARPPRPNPCCSCSIWYYLPLSPLTVWAKVLTLGCCCAFGDFCWCIMVIGFMIPCPCC
jgi:hypothetical protein